MIDTTAIIGFALMAIKNVQVSQSNQWKPSKQDVLALRAELKQYEPKEINGRKFYAFEQHLIKKGICSVLDNGQLAVVSPEMYRREKDIQGLSEWITDQDQKALFQAYPEEKAAWREEIQAMLSDMRGVIKKA